MIWWGFSGGTQSGTELTHWDPAHSSCWSCHIRSWGGDASCSCWDRCEQGLSPVLPQPGVTHCSLPEVQGRDNEVSAQSCAKSSALQPQTREQLTLKCLSWQHWAPRTGAAAEHHCAQSRNLCVRQDVISISWCLWMAFIHSRFRIPLTAQNCRPGAASRLQREWVSLLERHCQPQQGSPGCSSPEADYEEFIVPLNEQKEETPRFGGSCAKSSLSKPSSPLAEPAEGEAAPAPAAPPPPTGRAEVPPAPPALPQPCSLSPAAKRTKAFHWDVVPCDKVRMTLRVAVKGKKIEIL